MRMIRNKVCRVRIRELFIFLFYTENNNGID